MQDILSDFFVDTQSHLEQIEAHLLKLEQNPGQADLIDDVFRGVHSIKGNAGLLGILSVLAIGEEYENFLEHVRERGSATSEEVDAMLKSLDKLKAVVHEERAKTVLGGEDVADADKKEADVSSKGSVAPGDTQVSSKSVSLEDDDRAVKEEKKVTFLTFMLSGEKYGLDIMKVREIIVREPITPVPNTKFFVEGVMNLRDQVIPVFNLKSRLMMAEDEVNVEAKSTIVVEISKVTTGLSVDEVTGIITIAMSHVAPPADFHGTVPGEFLLGIGRTPEGPMILLDADILCNPEEILYEGGVA